MGVRLLFFVWLYNYKKLKAIKRLETDISPLRNNEAILLLSCFLTFFFRVNSKESQKKNKIWNIECMRKNETTKEVENLNNVVWNYILWKKEETRDNVFGLFKIRECTKGLCMMIFLRTIAKTTIVKTMDFVVNRMSWFNRIEKRFCCNGTSMSRIQPHRVKSWYHRSMTILPNFE